MLRIALCDDDKQELQITAGFMKKYKELRPNLAIELTVFSSGAALLSSFEGNKGYDLYILDVIMPQFSGIQTGVELRARNCDGLIIYLTNSPDFAVASYQTQAFYYLLKPIVAENLFAMLDKASASIAKRKAEAITVKTQEAFRLLPLRDILYAELVGRSIHYHLIADEPAKTLTFRGSFQKEVAPLLDQKYFVLSGSSFVVNLNYVTEVRKNELLLSNGALVPVPRNMYNGMKKQWMLHWLDGEA